MPEHYAKTELAEHGNRKIQRWRGGIVKAKIDGILAEFRQNLLARLLQRVSVKRRKS